MVNFSLVPTWTIYPISTVLEVIYQRDLCHAMALQLNQIYLNGQISKGPRIAAPFTKLPVALRLRSLGVRARARAALASRATNVARSPSPPARASQRASVGVVSDTRSMLTTGHRHYFDINVPLISPKY